jgi:hypothetical protein
MRPVVRLSVKMPLTVLEMRVSGRVAWWLLLSANEAVREVAMLVMELRG